MRSTVKNASQTMNRNVTAIEQTWHDDVDSIDGDDVTRVYRSTPIDTKIVIRGERTELGAGTEPTKAEAGEAQGDDVATESGGVIGGRINHIESEERGISRCEESERRLSSVNEFVREVRRNNGVAEETITIASQCSQHVVHLSPLDG